MFVPKEWKTAIEDMRQAGLIANAEDLQRRYDNYSREWAAPDGY